MNTNRAENGTDIVLLLTQNTRRHVVRRLVTTSKCPIQTAVEPETVELLYWQPRSAGAAYLTAGNNGGTLDGVYPYRNLWRTSAQRRGTPAVR